MYMVQLDRLVRGVAATPSDPVWTCHCLTCHGRRVDWLYFASRAEQRAHTIEKLIDLRDHLVIAPPGPQRKQAWRAQCQSAEFIFTSIAMTRVAWNVPPALTHWKVA